MGVKDGDCAGCWTASDGAPSCNLRGTQCLHDDGLSCQACWSGAPLPVDFLGVAIPVSVPEVALPVSLPVSNVTFGQDDCRTDIHECSSCCTGSCSACRGYCENVKDGDCAGCWKASDGAPPCNLRGCQCLADDGLACQLCWGAAPPSPSPSPTPTPTPSPSPSPSPEPCPGGSFAACIENCPSGPTKDFQACLKLCQERCDDWRVHI